MGRKRGIQNPHQWTKNQDKYILDNFKKKTVKEIAKDLGIEDYWKVESRIAYFRRQGILPLAERTNRTNPVKLQDLIKLNSLKVKFEPGSRYKISTRSGDKVISKIGTALSETNDLILFQFNNYRESFQKKDFALGRCWIVEE